MKNKNSLKIVEVPIKELRPSAYNPRKHTKEQAEQLKKSITKFEVIEPIICNSSPKRKNVIIGGHFRVEMAKELGMKTVPVIYINIPDLNKEKELNLRLNKNVGEFDIKLLAEYNETFLTDIGFNSEELDDIFPIEENITQFDLKKELSKLNIQNVTAQKSDIYELDGSRVMCGDSTIKGDVLKLMGKEKIDMVLTDPPYDLDYLKGKTKQKDGVTVGFGSKKNRRYLETESLPDDFTEKWMANIHKIAKDNFSIIVYENWKNLRTIWNEIEKYWKVKNMIVWHLPNRCQGFAARNKFFNKHDIAMVGATDSFSLNLKEEKFLENEYETALYAIGGKPHWQSYKKGSKYCPTDFIEYNAADERSSGQSVVFGVKPTEILIPYIKVLTKRNDLICEPFGGSGSVLIAATRMKRRCYLMEKSPVYTQVILKRWEKETGRVPKKIKL